MTLNASGPISLAGSTTGQSIALEIKQTATAQISLNDTEVRNLAGVPSGAIVMPTNFYGKTFTYTASYLVIAGGASGGIGVGGGGGAGGYLSGTLTFTPGSVYTATVGGGGAGVVEPGGYGCRFRAAARAGRQVAHHCALPQARHG